MISLEILRNEVILYQKSQHSVAKRLSCGAIFSDYMIANYF